MVDIARFGDFPLTPRQATAASAALDKLTAAGLRTESQIQKLKPHIGATERLAGRAKQNRPAGHHCYHPRSISIQYARPLRLRGPTKATRRTPQRRCRALARLPLSPRKRRRRQLVSLSGLSRTTQEAASASAPCSIGIRYSRQYDASPAKQHGRRNVDVGSICPDKKAGSWHHYPLYVGIQHARQYDASLADPISDCRIVDAGDLARPPKQLPPYWDRLKNRRSKMLGSALTWLRFAQER